MGRCPWGSRWPDPRHVVADSFRPVRVASARAALLSFCRTIRLCPGMKALAATWALGLRIPRVASVAMTPTPEVGCRVVLVSAEQMDLLAEALMMLNLNELLTCGPETCSGTRKLVAVPSRWSETPVVRAVLVVVRVCRVRELELVIVGSVARVRVVAYSLTRMCTVIEVNCLLRGSFCED